MTFTALASVSLEDKESSGEEDQSPKQTLAEPLGAEAKGLVAYFYSLFQPEVQKIYFNSKAIDQAVSLITRLGNDRARFVVDFSARVAPQTNYSPQTFGGILQYTSRAMSQFDEAERITTKQALIASCDFCSASGYRRIGNDMRLCSHDPAIESPIPAALAA